MQYYSQLLAAHLLVVTIFASGVVLNAAMLPSLRRAAGAGEPPAELRRLLRWTFYVTTPALCLVWSFGITLALLAGWFAAPWLQVKLALVLCLTALHFHQIHSTRQMLHGRRPKIISYWLVLLVAAVLAAIVFLATAKPI